MLHGIKYYYEGWFFIRVDGFEKMRFLWYSEREAIKRYREAHNLKYKKI